jgi:hypothetical protein
MTDHMYPTASTALSPAIRKRERERNSRPSPDRQPLLLVGTIDPHPLWLSSLYEIELYPCKNAQLSNGLTILTCLSRLRPGRCSNGSSVE